mgnify:CR=1 FL=1
MKRNRMRVMAAAVAVCVMMGGVSVSAAEQTKENDSTVIISQENDLQMNHINEKVMEKNLMILNRNVKETESGDFIIKEVETTYVPKTAANAIVKKAQQAYKSKDYTKEYSITHKKTNKLIFHVLLDATFKYNNTYAYVSERFVDPKAYNGAAFTGTVHSTSYSNRGNVAGLTLTANISGKLGGKKYNDKWKFNISCSKTGALSNYAKIVS